jgi:hypothetical protein
VLRIAQNRNSVPEELVFNLRVKKVALVTRLSMSAGVSRPDCATIQCVRLSLFACSPQARWLIILRHIPLLAGNINSFYYEETIICKEDISKAMIDI